MPDHNSNLIEIPKQFYSYAEKAPFQFCIECNKELYMTNSQYIIEKVIKRYPKLNAEDVIFEYAMCVSCAESFRSQLSKDSRRSMDEYFQDHLMSKHHDELITDPYNIEHNTNSCLIKGTSVKEVEEYQLFAVCKGKILMPNTSPYMLSGEVMDELSNLMSNHTIDLLNGFKNKHFGPPSEINDLLKDPSLVIV
ncbi:hypothetical protein [Marinigracilibium pacificum]|uniref:Uncharacterized protein n=1 Tax=Marinigracilibium pacificum TaxID=2729599 RepID=A0A848J5I4_9BACT|nr:hypothetical protein [Marinigracilibium pacificum]NMM50508.1 hypothetical protein [Marinigracilibium pacificum]